MVADPSSFKNFETPRRLLLEILKKKKVTMNVLYFPSSPDYKNTHP